MISKNEILEFATSSNLRPHVVEKDYVWGWLLAGIYQQAGIEVPVDKLIFDDYENPRGTISCQGRVFYRGPVSPDSYKRWPRIKLDLTVDEVLVEPAVTNCLLMWNVEDW